MNFPPLYFTLFQIGMFVCHFMYYTYYHTFSCINNLMFPLFPIAKSSACLLSLNLGVLILSCVSFYKRYIYIPFSFHSIHYISAFYIFVWSLLHTIAHYINLIFSVRRQDLLLSWGVGFTGHFLLFILLVTTSFALPIVRQKIFHKFFYIHVSCFVLFVSFILIHQSFCFVKPNGNSCPFLWSWLYYIIPFVIYTFEYIYRYCAHSCTSYNVRIHNQNSTTPNYIQLLLPLPKYWAGKRVWICCPNVSYFEWHPFALSLFDDSIVCTSLFFKNRGNWTNKFINALGASSDSVPFPVPLPKLLIHGPFLYCPKSFLNNLCNKPSIIFSFGIGITSFSFYLQQIVQQNISVTSTLHVVLTVKHHSELFWLMNILKTLHSNPKCFVHLFLTQPVKRELYLLDIPFYTEHPNIYNILKQSFLLNNFYSDKTVDIYHSGPPSTFHSIKSCVSQFNTITKQRFHITSLD